MANVQSQVMDHHGLVAATCQDLDIAAKVNARIRSADPRREVQPGTAVVAMILNGLGFTNRRLYLTPQFFESKPVAMLLGDNITAEQLNDHTLGKALDEIYNYGPTNFFSEIAFEIAHEKGLFGKTAHLDSTSFSVHGQYENNSTDSTTANLNVDLNPQETALSKKNREEEIVDPDNPKIIDVTYGYSKDRRADLKQVMMSLVTNGPAEIPLWMEPQSGNSSDKTTFHETAKRVQEFQKEFKNSPDFIWVADSAFYSKERILEITDYTWISRVPETLSECNNEVSKKPEEKTWIEYGNGYKYYEIPMNFGDVAQRWIVVFSEQAYKREMHTLEKNINKEKLELEKKIWHLKNKVFESPNQASQAIEVEVKKAKYHQITASVTEVKKMPGRGRPQKSAEPVLVGYKISDEKISIDQEKKDECENKKGKFVLATNELDKGKIDSVEILENYKNQQGVERGFRFIKNPDFMVDSIFVKKPSRIMALMVVMALCLMVFNISQYFFRKALQIVNETIPNQKKKPTQNPTNRWIFQCMEGIAVVLFKDPISLLTQVVITNLTALRQKIIRFWGPTAARIYGIQF